jgi:hypothetical protein
MRAGDCEIWLFVTLDLEGFHCLTSFVTAVSSAGVNCWERMFPCRLASSSPWAANSARHIYAWILSGRYAFTLREYISQAMLSRRKSLVGRKPPPPACLGLVFRNISATIVHLGQGKLRVNISLLGLHAKSLN